MMMVFFMVKRQVKDGDMFLCPCGTPGYPHVFQAFKHTGPHAPHRNGPAPLEDTLVSKGSIRIPSENNTDCLHRNKSDLLHVTSLFFSFFLSLYSPLPFIFFLFLLLFLLVV